MGRIMAWRTMELEGIKDKHQRAYYAALKARYALKAACGAAAVPADEAAHRRREQVAHRFRQAQEHAAAALCAEPPQRERKVRM